MSKQPPDELTSAEVQARLGITRQGVAHLVRAGHIKARWRMRNGVPVRMYSRASIEAYEPDRKPRPGKRLDDDEKKSEKSGNVT